MDNWEKRNETSFSKKWKTWKTLNMEYIIDADIKQAKKKEWVAFEIKNLAEYHDLNSAVYSELA